MTEAYFTEDQKMYASQYQKWTGDECYLIRDILREKGYDVNCVLRVGCDRKYHDAWQVQREDVGRLIEQLFRQRIVVEVQAEGHGKASINFVYDYAADTIISAVKKFWKNRRDDL